MRSIVIFLKGSARADVIARLSEFGERIGLEWRYPSATEADLYIRFYDELNAELDDDDWTALISGLGQKPDEAVIADISGRIVGLLEAKALSMHLLSKFNGVVWDDYTTHSWTIDEVRSGALSSGHVFFDTEGWYNERQKA